MDSSPAVTSWSANRHSTAEVPSGKPTTRPCAPNPSAANSAPSGAGLSKLLSAGSGRRGTSMTWARDNVGPQYTCRGTSRSSSRNAYEVRGVCSTHNRCDGSNWTAGAEGGTSGSTATGGRDGRQRREKHGRNRILTKLII